jgi:NAD(P)-dependent dehydrogenase (short-subunit alcohol dehydrogenase family)
VGAGRLEGKVAIVTGAARGLGATIAESFAQERAAVLLTDVRDELGEQTAEGIRAAGGQAAYHHLDVTEEEDWSAAGKSCVEAFATEPNVFVSNAVIWSQGELLDKPLAEWRAEVDVILHGAFLGIRAVLPAMLDRGAGTIVGVASVFGPNIAAPGLVGYQAAKGGLAALVRNVAVTYGSRGIRANTLHPGPMPTPKIEEENFGETMNTIAATFPLGRVGSTQEVAAGAVFLASDESSYMTGSSLIIDGGQVAS